mgnify:CR=1 FL=1
MYICDLIYSDMLKDTFKNSEPFSKIIQLVFVSFISLLVAVVFTLMIGIDTTNILSLKFNQLFESAMIFIFPPVFLGFIWYDNPVESFSLKLKPTFKIVFLVVLLMIAITPFINLLSYLNEQMAFPESLKKIEIYFKEMEDAAAEITKQMLNVNSFGGLFINLFIIAIVPAIGEELYFRGTLQKIISEKNSKTFAIWITAIIFSLIHFQMYGFLPRMILGALFGYLLVWSGSLWVPVIAHFTNNGMAVLFSYFEKDNADIGVIENIGKSETYWTGIISAVIAGWIIWQIYKISQRKPEKTDVLIVDKKG